MAERRMFAKTIIDSDAFLDMPLSAQALYFHLSMRADDDGFINNPKKIQRMIGAADDDLKLLLMKRFVIGFESGVVVIKHWKIHNYIQKDRYKPTIYQEEKAKLCEKDNKAYTEDIPALPAAEPDETPACIQPVSIPETQVRLGKVRSGKERLEGIVPDKPAPRARFVKPTLDEVRAYCQERKNTVDPERFFDYYESNGWKVGKSPMKDWKATVRNWERNRYDTKKPAKDTGAHWNDLDGIL